MKYYAHSTGGFYDSALHKTIPEDAKAITDAEWSQLIEAQAGGKVFVISGGNVTAVEPDSLLTADELASATVERAKAKAQSELAALDVLLPRCVEDLIDVQGIDKTTLPQIMQERIAKKAAAREVIRS